MSRHTMASEADATDQDPFDACANCGASFEVNRWYPVETREEPDGELEVYSFCNDECQAAWTAED